MNHGKDKDTISYSISTLFLPVSVPGKTKQHNNNKLRPTVMPLKSMMLQHE